MNKSPKRLQLQFAKWSQSPNETQRINELHSQLNPKLLIEGEPIQINKKDQTTEYGLIINVAIEADSIKKAIRGELYMFALEWQLCIIDLLDIATIGGVADPEVIRDFREMRKNPASLD